MSEIAVDTTLQVESRWKPYPAYKDSGIEWLGEIPEGWEVSKIGVIASVKARLGWKGLKASEYVDEGYIFLSTPNIKTKDIDFKNVNYITAERYYESPEIMLQEDDILIAKDGSTLGITNVVRFLPANATVNSSIAVIRPRESFDSVYLYYFFSSHFIQSVIQRMKDGMGVPHLFQADLRKFVVLIPPLWQQNIIADFLDCETTQIDTLIAKKERLVELLTEKRTAIISHAVTKGVDPNVPMKDSGVEWIGKVPAHWGVIQSKRVFKVRNEPALESDEQLTASQKYGMLPQTEFMELEGRRVVVTIKGMESLRHVEPNDFVISLRSFQGGIEWCKFRGSVTFHYVVLKPVKTLHPAYFGYLFKSSVFIQALRSTVDFIRDGQDLRYSHFALVPLPVVPMDEQVAIATYLDCEISTIDALISKIREHIEKLKEYRTAIISAAVTGKIDVRSEVS